jgi:hypothetical protein
MAETGRLLAFEAAFNRESSAGCGRAPTLHRAFFLRAYLLQTHEMLFDAHHSRVRRVGRHSRECVARPYGSAGNKKINIDLWIVNDETIIKMRADHGWPRD